MALDIAHKLLAHEEDARDQHNHKQYRVGIIRLLKERGLPSETAGSLSVRRLHLVVGRMRMLGEGGVAVVAVVWMLGVKVVGLVLVGVRWLLLVRMAISRSTVRAWATCRSLRRLR